ncbi:MAG: plasma-membrane proton-efflux P-type ATPase [Candidatus Cryosericum sp.]
MEPGLTSAEAQKRLEQFGPNEVPEHHDPSWLVLFRKVWGPVPWMLELSLILELITRHYTQATIIGALIVFNAVIGFVQEHRAQDALRLLQQRLVVHVRVLRDGTWQTMDSRSIVPDDIVHLRMGDLVPADMTLSDGNLLIDQSVLTGESLPKEAGAGTAVYAGGVVKRGEASGNVTGTGTHTYFGRTAQLVGSAKTASHLQETIIGIVKFLLVLDVLLVVGVVVYSLLHGIPLLDTVSFSLMLLVSSVPVALPAVFTLASAVGAQELVSQGVLVTRLSAIEEAAAMTVLFSDKTGTITENRLKLVDIVPVADLTKDQVLRLALLSSDERSQDPIDLAIIARAREANISVGPAAISSFTPFDSATKRTEAIIVENGVRTRIVKGSPQIIESLVSNSQPLMQNVALLADRGNRVLAVATGSEDHLTMAGLLALEDPPRDDSAALINDLKAMGIRTVMVTGDTVETARTVAAQIGLGTHTCDAATLRGQTDTPDSLECDVVAGVLPEDKYTLVRRTQQAGSIVGMTGDGVNDAPALQQAEVGIAVADATDVARAAASAILTNPGLGGIVKVVTTGRQIYQRMLSYTLNKIIKTLQIALFLAVAFFATGRFVTSPRLILLLLFANDFVTMSLASDSATASQLPDRWRVSQLTGSALLLAVAWLAVAFGTLYVGTRVLHYDLPHLQTMVFFMLVLTGQANVYLVRERRHFWRSRPGRALILSTIGDLLVIGFMASRGILMVPLPLHVLAFMVAGIALYAILLDFYKLAVFRWFRIVG